MEMMTMRTTNADTFDISVANGLSNYNIKLSASALLLATYMCNRESNNNSTTVSDIMFERSMPSVYFSKDSYIKNAVSYSIIIHKVLDFYNIGKTHLCKIAGVTRPTLYAWLYDNSVPEIENFKKINQLYNFYLDLGSQITYKIYQGYMDRPFDNYYKSLLDVLIEKKDLNTESIKEHIRAALLKSIDREQKIIKRRSESFKIHHSDSELSLNLEENL